MIVNDANRAKAAAILDRLMAEAVEEYGIALVYPQPTIDEIIRMTRPGHLKRMLRTYYDVDASLSRQQKESTK